MRVTPTARELAEATAQIRELEQEEREARAEGRRDDADHAGVLAARIWHDTNNVSTNLGGY